jgi:pimeloyl-ACP methyl ester carboxylesterase
MDRTVLARLAGELATIDLHNAIEELSCPLLLTHGLQDSVVRSPGKLYSRLDETTRNPIFIAFDSVGHFPMLDTPEQFNRLLIEFAQVEWEQMSALAIKEHWRRRTY